MVVNIAYDYRITIIIREYEICTEHKIHMDCMLRTCRGIDRHTYKDIVAQHTVYRYRGPVWVDDIDPVWIIIAAPFGSYR